MINTRKIALEALLSVDKDLAYSNLVLKDVLSDNSVNTADKPFITALFYGVLDRKITLDYIISKFVKKPISKITPITLNALRIAVYQILYMDKVPESAAVNESVKLVKNSKEKFNSAFVNAVLRNYLRQSVKLPEDNSALSLSIRYSCPVWIINSFLNDYGEENTIGILEHFLTVPDITVRVNSIFVSDLEFEKAIESENLHAEKATINHAYHLKDGVDIKSLDCYIKGLFYVQDIQSQIAVSKLNITAGERVLDMCAAPGGKTFYAGISSGDGAFITACDIYEKRVNLIRQSASRLGLKNIEYRVCDSSTFNNSLGKFDAVICDVPCSGLGVIRRKPEIKYKEDLNLEQLKATQSAILENGLKYLKPGGRILYSTCTIRRAENEDIVRACLDKHSNYELKYEHTFLPTVDFTDGFYCAVIKSR